MAKIFVLDTNIILHDYKSVRHFQDNDIVIPIAVIEELDKFKKGNDALSFNARAFMRDINKLTDKQAFGPRGVPLGGKLGYIKIEPNHPFAPEFQDLFRDDIQDHRILSTSLWRWSPRTSICASRPRRPAWKHRITCGAVWTMRSWKALSVKWLW